MQAESAGREAEFECKNGLLMRPSPLGWSSRRPLTILVNHETFMANGAVPAVRRHYREGRLESAQDEEEFRSIGDSVYDETLRFGAFQT